MANDLTLISNNGSGCSSTQYYELDGCANCVPYKKFIPLSECACPTDEIKYLNLDTGDITTVAPTGFTIGKCNDKPDGKVCYKVNDNGTDVNVSIVTSGCCTTYYENDVEVTDAARIAALEALIEATGCDAVVDCVTKTDSNLCWNATQTITQTYSAVSISVLRTNPAFVAGKVYLLKSYSLWDIAANQIVPGSTITYNNVVMYDGTNVVSAATIAPILEASGLFQMAQSFDPRWDRMTIAQDPDNPSNVRVSLFDDQNVITTANMLYQLSYELERQDGVPVNFTNTKFSPLTDVVDTRTSDYAYRVVYLNGTATYYRDGVELTSQTDIDLAKAALAAADPADVVCCPDCAPNSKVCYEIGADSYSVVTFNGEKTYYKNDTQLVGSADIAAAEAAIAGAQSTNLVDCTAPAPDSTVCYSITTTNTTTSPPITQTYAVAECLEFGNFTAGVPTYLPTIRLRSVASGTTLQTVTFSPALQIWDGTTRITPTAFIAALNAAGYLAKAQLADPRIDRFDVVSAGTTRIYAFDNQNTITSGNRVFNHNWDYSNSATGTPIAGTVNNGNYSNITSTYTTTTTTTVTNVYRATTVNDVVTYYKDGVKLTAAADITAAETALATATADNVIDCSKSLLDGKVCYKIGTDTYSVVTVNGVVTYYKNGTLLTLAADITAAETAVAAATASEVVDCVTMPNTSTCYDITTSITQTYLAVEGAQFVPGPAGIPQLMSSLNFRLASGGGDVPGNFVYFTPDIPIWDGTSMMTAAAFKTALESSNFLSVAKTVDPRWDRFDVVQSGANLRIYLFDNENQYTTANRLYRIAYRYSTVDGGAESGANIQGAYTNILNTYSSQNVYKTVTVNGVTTYYKDGVKLTVAADITAAQTAIASATADNVIDCSKSLLDGKVCYKIGADTYSVVTVNGSSTYYKNGTLLTLAADITAAETAVAGATYANVVDCTQALLDGKMCYKIGADTYSVVTVNGASTYYKNGVLLTVAADITAAETAVAAATASQVVDCVTMPNTSLCYDITTPITQTYAATETLEIPIPVAGTPIWMGEIAIQPVAGATQPPVVLSLSPYIQVWDGANYISTATVKSQLEAAGFLQAWQAVDPRIDRFDVVIVGTRMRIYLFDNQNQITTANRIAFNSTRYSSTNGGVLGGANGTGAYTNITSTYNVTNQYKVVTLNGVSTYYKDGVKLTLAADITAAQAAIATATVDNIVCCDDCDVVCQAYMDTETFTATAGQTTFTLSKAPSGDVRFSRNGAALADSAATVLYKTVTYVPAENNATALLAGDRIEISYIYNVCTGGGATNVDGSETKVTAGSGVTVAGTGTAGNPYVVGMSTPIVVSASTPAATSAANVTWTGVVGYTVTDIDTSGGAWNATTGIFTAPRAGYYQLNGSVELGSAAWPLSTQIALRFVKNGSINAYVTRDFLPAAATIGLDLRGSGVVYLAAGDTIQMSVLHSGGAARTISSSIYTNFSIHEIK